MKINRRLRLKVKEITLDMAGSMKRIAKRCFPNASLVIERFHVQKLAIEALQEIRIKYLWEAIEMENSFEEQYPQTQVFENGDIRKQLLARADTCFIKDWKNGLYPKGREPASFLLNILTWNRRIS